MRREFSSGGLVVRRFRGRPFLAVVEIDRGKRVLSLPKGHPDPGETAEQAALREVREEAGLTAEITEKLGDVRYWYSLHGERRLKVVSFFLCRYRSGSLRDHDYEVDAARWVPLAEAPARLEYRGERDMAQRALERVGSSGRSTQ